MEPLPPDVDHMRGGPSERTIVEYGDCECPYSRRGYAAAALLEALG
jgi:hypothetical protein